MREENNNDQNTVQNIATDKRVLLVGKLKGKKEVDKKKTTKKKTTTKPKTNANTTKKTATNKTTTKKATKSTTNKTVQDKSKSKTSPKKTTKTNTSKKTTNSKSRTKKNSTPKVVIKEDANKLKKESEKVKKPASKKGKKNNKKPNKIKKAEVEAYVLRIKEIGLSKVSNKTIKDVCIVMLVTALITSLIYIAYIGEQSISNKMSYSSLTEEFEKELDQLVSMGAPASENVKILAKENPDIKGWIKIEGTNINYPLLQGLDNEYYLTHDYKNQYTNYGSIYMNANSNIKDVNSNIIIYGHDMKDGQMFSELAKYADEEYYKEHPIIKIITDTSENEYEIVSAFKSRVFYKDEKNVFRFYQNYNLDDEDKYNDYIYNCKKLQLYNTGVEAKPGDQLITLITCEYSQENGRMVVVARKK